jgi:hypothetical protein
MKHILLIFLLLQIVACKEKKEVQRRNNEIEEHYKIANKAGDLNVEPIHQRTGVWCWAACCQMVHKYYGNDIEQCDIVKMIYGSSCCESSSVQNCNSFNSICSQTAYSNEAFQKTGISYGRSSSRILTWEEIVFGIDKKKKPMAYEYYLSNGKTHLTLIVGYMEQNNEKFLIINNPKPPCRIDSISPEIITYSKYRGNGYYEYERTYTDLNK